MVKKRGQNTRSNVVKICLAKKKVKKRSPKMWSKNIVKKRGQIMLSKYVVQKCVKKRGQKNLQFIIVVL